MVKSLGKIPGIALQLILGILWGLPLAWFAFVSAVQFGPHTALGLLLYLVLLFVIFFLTYWAAVIIHEAGHLLAALALGLRVFSFHVGRAGIRRQGKGFQLQWIPRPPVPGAVVAFPKEVRFWRGREAIFITGGSLASLIAAVLCFLGAYRINEGVVVSFPGPISTWNKILVPRTHGTIWLASVG
jgi:hypothetical protein